MNFIHITHANTVHMSHQGLSGTSVGPHTTFLSRFQNPRAVGNGVEKHTRWEIGHWPRCHMPGRGFDIVDLTSRCFVQWVHTDCLRKRAFPMTTRIEVLEDSKRRSMFGLFLTRCPRGHNRNGVGSGPEHAGLIFMMSWLSTMQKTAQF